jgi:predicted nucleic acid-binding protein
VIRLLDIELADIGNTFHNAYHEMFLAKIHNVRIEGTYGIILRALLRDSISKDKAEDSLQKLVSSGWRCDVELYNKLIMLIRESK